MDGIAQAVTLIQEGTTESLDGAHQSQVAAESLNDLATKLSALTERYRIA
jgi:methyl-accepting chemotaxis protein